LFLEVIQDTEKGPQMAHASATEPMPAAAWSIAYNMDIRRVGGIDEELRLYRVGALRVDNTLVN